MPVRTKTFELTTKGDCDIVDITPQVRTGLTDADISSGIVTVFVPGSTCGVTTLEYESGAVRDLRDAVERIAPRDIRYAHNDRWGDGNGHSHIRAALFGPSLSIPFSGGAPLLGTWQQIVLVDFDNRPRTRKIVLQITGE